MFVGFIKSSFKNYGLNWLLVLEFFLLWQVRQDALIYQKKVLPLLTLLSILNYNIHCYFSFLSFTTDCWSLLFETIFLISQRYIWGKLRRRTLTSPSLRCLAFPPSFLITTSLHLSHIQSMSITVRRDAGGKLQMPAGTPQLNER